MCLVGGRKRHEMFFAYRDQADAPAAGRAVIGSFRPHRARHQLRWRSPLSPRVLLNFANVVGRYLLGVSPSARRGAGVHRGRHDIHRRCRGDRRNAHLRMDVLLRFYTPVLAAADHRAALLITLAGFVAQSISTPGRWRIGRMSDMAGIPMWIPHATVARFADPRRRRWRSCAWRGKCRVTGRPRGI